MPLLFKTECDMFTKWQISTVVKLLTKSSRHILQFNNNNKAKQINIIVSYAVFLKKQMREAGFLF